MHNQPNDPFGDAPLWRMRLASSDTSTALAAASLAELEAEQLTFAAGTLRSCREMLPANSAIGQDLGAWGDRLASFAQAHPAA